MVALLFPPPLPLSFLLSLYPIYPRQKMGEEGGGGAAGGRNHTLLLLPHLSAVGLSALFCNCFRELVTEIWADNFFIVVFSKKIKILKSRRFFL